MSTGFSGDFLCLDVPPWLLLYCLRLLVSFHPSWDRKTRVIPDPDSGEILERETVLEN